MSSTINQAARTQADWGRRARQAIVVNAHPGGRFPGVELPPTWFAPDANAMMIPSVLPKPGDLVAIYDAVHAMGADIRDAALEAYARGKHPMLIGGDHSLVLGSLAAATRAHPRVGVIWIDAHADFNVPETSPTGNPHGMPLAVSCGLGDERLLSLYDGHVAPRDDVLIGARDIDPGEAALLREQGIWHVTVEEAREKLGIRNVEVVDTAAVSRVWDGRATPAEAGLART